MTIIPSTTGRTLPIIAIVGRPNVGKSSLFNRLIHQRRAITSEVAGTTRDRNYYRTEIGDFTATLVDTGGLEYGKKENIEADVQSQVMLAVQDADIILFVVDAKELLTIEDYEAAQKLRKAKKNILLVANKIDANASRDNMETLKKMGFGEPVEISAYHNLGVENLESSIEVMLHEKGFVPTRKTEQSSLDSGPFYQKMRETINVCFLGKPNVGKSSLVNALLGKDRVIVSSTPGTTRDSIDTEVTFEDQSFNLIDTAGLRKRGRIEKGLEKLSSFRSLDAIERADVVCLILDYEEGIKAQDQHISSYIQEAGKGLILIVNKSDLMEEKQEDEQRTIQTLKSRFDFLPWAPVIFTSALRKKNIEKILELSRTIYQERFRRIPDEDLMEFMKEITWKHVPAGMGKTLPKFFSLYQDAVNPPSFVYRVKNSGSIHFSYKRYLENELRKKYGFTGTGIQIWFKEKSLPKRSPKRPFK